ncbi:MAG: hypothetical protein R6V31_08650 [Halohasta sp.]
MTDYKTDDGERLAGSVVFSKLCSKPWTVVSADNDGDTTVVKDPGTT